MTKRYINRFVWTCPECGGHDVEGKCWVNLNTDEVGGTADGDYWCNTCYAASGDGELKRINYRPLIAEWIGAGHNFGDGELPEPETQPLHVAPMTALLAGYSAKELVVDYLRNGELTYV